MARLAFCDYHNMVAILEKSEYNVDFHLIVDFVEASQLMYALTFKPTVYVSHIRQFWSTARIETMKEGTNILATIDGILITISKSSIRRNLKLKDEAGIIFPSVEVSHPYHHPVFESKKYWVQRGEGSRTPTEPHHTPSPEAQQTLPTTHSSPSLPPITTATITPVILTLPLPTVVPTDTPQLRNYTRRARIAQSSALPPVADEPASPLRDVSQGEACLIVSSLEAEQDRGRRLDEGEEATERISDDTEEMATVLTSMDATSILTSGGVQVDPTAVAVATATISIPTGNGVVPTASPTIPTVAPIFATATVLEEEMERDAQRMNEQISRDTEIARIHAKEELQIMIDGLDRNNKTVAKYLQEYHQFATELPIERKIELISDLVRYQDNYAKVHKYQTQQRKPLIKKQQREFYTSVLKNQAGWKAKDFKGITLEEIKENFDPVWKQIQDFIPIGSKEEAERFKRKGIRFEQESVKKLKTIEEVKTTEEVLTEKVKEMIQLILVKEVYVEALQVKHPIIDWKHLDREDLNQLWRLVKKTLSIRPASKVPPARRKFPLSKKSDATAERIALLSENMGQQTADETPAHAHVRLLVHTTWEDPKDGTVYMEIKCDIPLVRATAQTPPSLVRTQALPKWFLKSPLVLPVVPSPVATLAPVATLDGGDLLKIGAHLELHGTVVCQKILSHRFRLRNLERGQDETGITLDITTELLEASHGRNANWITIEHPTGKGQRYEDVRQIDDVSPMKHPSPLENTQVNDQTQTMLRKLVGTRYHAKRPYLPSYNSSFGNSSLFSQTNSLKGVRL
uniref:Xylulose kinase-1 n=1 Tax=Tanacetum cinerariifolium TaxID=118510 RepID=A0A6L2M8A5_TANCI|nr:hypothetical protein [Tanacetum cinerariifolium]